MSDYLHSLIKKLSSSCMIIIDLSNFIQYSELKKRVQDGSYGLSKLEIFMRAIIWSYFSGMEESF